MNTHTGWGKNSAFSIFHINDRLKQLCRLVHIDKNILKFVAGLRPYSCDGCKETFEEYKSLYKHVGSCDRHKMLHVSSVPTR